MGCCLQLQTENLEKLEEDDTQLQNPNIKSEVKSVLIGIGNSGKTALFKQLKTLYSNNEYDEYSRKNYQKLIHEQLIYSMKLLINTLSIWISETKNKCIILKYTISPELNESKSIILSINTTSEIDITSNIALHLIKLWKDPAIQICYKQRHKLGIPDSTSIFFNKLDIIITNNYIPNNNDILLTYARTTGISDLTFLYKNKLKYKIYDIGGHRNERKKWNKLLLNNRDITCIIFVVSLSCYNEMLFEDSSINAMDETMKIFEEYINNIILKNCCWYIFFNKTDLFSKKIKEEGIIVCNRFKDYKGRLNHFDDSIEYIKMKFDQLNKDKCKKLEYKYICGIDLDQMYKCYTQVLNGIGTFYIDKVYSDYSHSQLI